MTVGRLRALAAPLAAGLALTGCAGTSILPGHHRSGASDVHGPAAPSAEIAVVRGWANALRTGHLRRAAAYFHLPSVFENGGVITIHSLAEAEIANSTLSCGAEVISAFQVGRYVDVLFRLTDRAGQPGVGCGSGVGQTARTQFLIRHGKILVWRRAPSLPGDPGAPGSGGGGSGGNSGAGGGTPV